MMETNHEEHIGVSINSITDAIRAICEQWLRNDVTPQEQIEFYLGCVYTFCFDPQKITSCNKKQLDGRKRLDKHRPYKVRPSKSIQRRYLLHR